MAEKSNDTLADFGILQFYDKVTELLLDAGRYAHSYKLRENLNDSATRFKVEHVFQKYYSGNMTKLKNDIHFRRRQCLATIAEINRLCDRMGIMPVRDKDALVDLLIDEGRREGWKKLVNKYQKENKIVTLQSIEKEYRKNLNKKAP